MLVINETLGVVAVRNSLERGHDIPHANVKRPPTSFRGGACAADGLSQEGCPCDGAAGGDHPDARAAVRCEVSALQAERKCRVRCCELGQEPGQIGREGAQLRRGLHQADAHAHAGQEAVDAAARWQRVERAQPPEQVRVRGEFRSNERGDLGADKVLELHAVAHQGDERANAVRGRVLAAVARLSEGGLARLHRQLAGAEHGA